MQKAAVLVSLLLLGWTWTLQGLPVLPEPLYPTQENFDISRFLGTWHDVAVASTCAYMQRNRGDAAIGKLVLQRGATEGKLKTTKTGGGTCKEMTGDYELTGTPGRFFYHIEKWGADVDAYVVHTNYIEYAIVIMSKAKSTGDKSTAVKLYSRTKTVRATVLEDFKTLVREQGMSDDTIVIKKDKGTANAHIVFINMKHSDHVKCIQIYINITLHETDYYPQIFCGTVPVCIFVFLHNKLIHMLYTVQV
uniref:Lipocalin/cytosolic fatty-acid binding domain-containing protein n=1 Tax=Amphiprion ocellaris TaxID=80972 RepID=A0AAQ6AND9_AMPOC